MSSLLSAVRRHPLASYVVVAFGLTWLAALPLVLESVGLTQRAVPPALHALGTIGPVAATVVITAVVGGRAGLGRLGRDATRWRVGALSWGLAIGTPLLFGAIGVGVLAALGDPSLDVAALRSALRDPQWLLVSLLASLVYGIGEEPGWRGFLLSRLQAGRSALGATLILAPIWAAWHAPMFFYRFSLEGIGAYVGFFVSLAAGAIWLTFLYNTGGGSVLIVMVWHTLWNVVSVAGLAISPNVTAVASGCVMLAAIAALIVGTPKRLSMRDKHVWVPEGIERATLEADLSGTIR